MSGRFGRQSAGRVTLRNAESPITVPSTSALPVNGTQRTSPELGRLSTITLCELPTKARD